MSKRLLGSAATYTAANLFSKLFPILLVPVLTRLLSPHDYGVVAVFNAAVSFLIVIVGLGVHGTILIQYYSLSKIELSQLVSACIYVMAVSLMVVIVGVSVFLPQISRISSVPAIWIYLACLVAALQFVITLRLSVLQAQKKSSKYAALQSLQAICSAGFSIVLIVVAHMAWQGRVVGIFLASLMLALTSIFGLRRDGLLVLHTTLQRIKAATAFGVTLLPHVLGGLFIALSDQILVAALLGTSAAGLFSVAMSVGSAIALVTVSLNRAWAPWIFEFLPGMNYERKVEVARYTYAYFLALAIASVCFGLLAPFAMKILVGKAFAASASTVLIISVGYAFGGMYFSVTNYVFLAGAASRLGNVTATVAVVNVVLTYLLIKIYGLAGAGYGFAVSQALLFLGTWRLSNEVSPMPWGAAIRSLHKLSWKNILNSSSGSRV